MVHSDKLIENETQEPTVNFDKKQSNRYACRLVGRAALALTLAIGGMTGYQVRGSTESIANAESLLSYPWANAGDYNPAAYEWWIDENGNGKPDVTVSETDNDETMDPNGYYYRNCTSYVAWRVQKEFGIIPSGYGNATTWDDVAKINGYTVDDTPEPGDVAVWDFVSKDDKYGHVSFVESVNPDGTVNVTDYNFDAKGNPMTRKSVKAHHYIDFNGTGVGINGTAVQGGINSYAAVGEGQELTDDNWVYTKVGGSAWPIKPKNEWTASDSAYWGNDPYKVAGTEIHDHEAGYGQTGRLYGAHPPTDGTDVYLDGGDGKQWYFIRGHAYPVSSGEVDDLGIRDRALRIPATDGRLADFLYGNLPLTNRMRYRFAGTALVRLMAQQNGGGFHAFDVASDTALSCLEFIDGGQTIILPQSALPYVEYQQDQVLVMHHQAACEYRSNMVVNGPGGIERWAISGDGDGLPYARHYYNSQLSVMLNTDGNPDYKTLRSVTALNNVPQGADMGIPDYKFFRVNESQQIFRYSNGQLHLVPNTATLACLGNPVPINLPQSTVEGMSQGAMESCAYENKIIRVGTNDYYVSQGASHLIQNPVIENCIVVRKGTGQPVPVDMATSNKYTLQEPAHCTYEQEPGLNFVREDGDTTVWLVHADGTKQHVGSLCYGSLKKYQVFVVPRGETGGHRQTGDWFATAAGCTALPG